MDPSHLGFLVNDVARLYRRRFDEVTRSLGITGPQMRALIGIGRAPGINQGTLAEKLEVEPITTCRMVDRLEQAGLVERRRDPHDRRAWQLHLTPAADPIMQKMQALGEIVLGESIMGMNEGSVDAVRSGLDTIRRNLMKALSPVQEQKAATHG
ncbi:MarR family winged helix-turn-helix transcriptional regulator [Sphingobium sp. CR28]|uniref:MarR family winged helix-turn-helix transcriptional regulator n=1 Tax=Sphingobium sp. CR28 TaxID=3400272 RepID=UPI003FF0E7AF